MVGDGIGLSETEDDGVVDGSGVNVGPVGAWGLGDERKGMKVTDPKLKSFLKSKIVLFIAWVSVVPHQLLVASRLTDAPK